MTLFRFTAIATCLHVATAFATGEDYSSRSYSPICADAERIVFLETHLSTQGGSGMTHEWSWVALEFKPMKLQREPIAKTDSVPEYFATDLPKDRQWAKKLGGKSLGDLLTARPYNCSRDLNPPHPYLAGLVAQNDGKALLLKLNGAQRSIPFGQARGATDLPQTDSSDHPVHHALRYELTTAHGTLFILGETFVLIAPQAFSTGVGQLLNDVGYLAHKQGRFADAVPLFGEAVTVDPKNATAPYNLACAYARLKDAPSAVRWLAWPSVPQAKLFEKVTKDPDFNPIREAPELKALLERLKNPDGGRARDP